MVFWQVRRAASFPHAQSTNASKSRKESALEAKVQCVARTHPPKPWPSSSPPILPYHSTFSSSPPAFDTFGDPSHDPNVNCVPAKPLTFSTNDLQMDIHAMIDKIGSLAIQTANGADGPFIVDWSSWDLFERVRSAINPSYKLSWGIDCDGETAIRETMRNGRKYVMGLIVFWGDASIIHELISTYLIKCVESASGEVDVDATCGGLFPMPYSIGTTRTGRQDKQRSKNPDAAWHRSIFGGAPKAPICVAEIAWSNESIKGLNTEVDLWTAAGANALGIKLAYKGACGDTPAERVYHRDDDYRSVSVCMLVGTAGTTIKRRFSWGPTIPSSISLPPTEGDTAVLPLQMFTRDPRVGDKKIAFSLAAIAYIVHRNIRGQAEAAQETTWIEEKRGRLRLIQIEVEALRNIRATTDVTALIDIAEAKLAQAQAIVDEWE